jgi:hypothetical protein
MSQFLVSRKMGSLLEVIDCDERHSGVGRPHVILCACCSNQERSMSYEQKSSRRDHLTSTTKDGKIELTEEQLSRVGGGYVRVTGLLKFSNVSLKVPANQ